MKKTVFLSIILIFSFAFLTACSNSKDKIIEAQSKYRELVETHNRAVEAYKGIKDNSLDEELKALSVEIDKVKEYNLYDMREEEIDTLIGVMDNLEETYKGYLDNIESTKALEDAAVLKDRMFSLRNETGMVLDSLSLVMQGDMTEDKDALEAFGGFKQGQEIIGLTVYFDVNNTPWDMYIEVNGENEEIKTYVVTLSSDILRESGQKMVLSYDEETDTMSITE